MQAPTGFAAWLWPSGRRVRSSTFRPVKGRARVSAADAGTANASNAGRSRLYPRREPAKDRVEDLTGIGPMDRLRSTLLAAGGLVAVIAAMEPAAQARDTTAARGASKGTGEVTSFLKRRSRCGRISNGDADDPGLVAENVRARFALKCATLQEEESRLRARYDSRPDVIEALDQDIGPDAADAWFLPSPDP